MDERNNLIADYVKSIVSLKASVVDRQSLSVFYERIGKAFSLLPEEVLDLFLKGSRKLVVVVMADTDLPLGMITKSEGHAKRRKYTVLTYAEHVNWPENHFIGAFLRELAHAVSEKPPKEEWPVARGDRARFKEKLEHSADALVWKWGLRHYSMSHLAATYPPHWVERIVAEIEKTLLEEEQL
ncbi:MAG: hypothetical protein HY913_08890 [Desulfomonile tiedjei]|nr:hypothetical protein [Desulfomonile tiedjei]